MAGEEGQEFSIEALDESVRAGVQAHIDREVNGLKRNQQATIGEARQAKERADALQAQLEGLTSKFGDTSPDDIAEMLQARQEGDFEKLIGEKKFEEAVDLKLKRERAALEKAKEKALAEAARERDEVASERDKYAETVKELRLSDQGKAIFSKVPNHEPSAAGTVAREVRETFTLDEQNQPVALDEFGEVKTDPKGNPWTIEYFVTEVLPETMSFLFKTPEGAGAKGSRGGVGSRDYGLGIQQRKGVTDDLRAAHFAKSRERGVDPTEAWNRIPFEAG